jgi:hypothetical protein
MHAHKQAHAVTVCHIHNIQKTLTPSGHTTPCRHSDQWSHRWELLEHIPVATLTPCMPTSRHCHVRNIQKTHKPCTQHRAGTVINGHIDGSFSNTSLWPLLHQTLAASGPTGQSAFGTYAAEISHVSDATLTAFRESGVPVSVEDPTWTQCMDGEKLGNLSFLGEPADLFCSIFTLCPPGILGQGNAGWCVSHIVPNPFSGDQLRCDRCAICANVVAALCACHYLCTHCSSLPLRRHISTRHHTMLHTCAPERCVNTCSRSYILPHIMRHLTLR